MTFDWSAFFGAFPGLLVGAKVTLLVALIALPLGFLLGCLLGFALTYGPKPVELIARFYVWLIRGTPMIVQIMFIYFALPELLGFRLGVFAAGVTSLIVNESAYLAEIVRGGLLSVPKGLHEAGLAMGLPLRKVVASVVGPVAFRRMLPALGNQFIIGMKDTSLLMVIGVAELTQAGQNIMTENYRAVEVWLAVALIYLGIISCMAALFKFTEHRTRIS